MTRGGQPSATNGGGKRGRLRVVPTTLSATFERFFESEKASGLLLMACSVVALVVTNSPLGNSWHHLWAYPLAGLTLEQWVNDGLMAVFFLLIGLELEREFYVGELSSVKHALLPAGAAIGGMAIPALMHWMLNAGTATQNGAGIPMATDIAFALGVLALLGSRAPSSLKVFIVAFAVMDDLGAVIVIAAVYSRGLSVEYLLGAVVLLMALVALNRLGRVMSLLPYLMGGALLWWLLLRSGLHPTLAGVALAFAVPFSALDAQAKGPSHRLEHALQRPVAFGIVPVFALANSGLLLNSELVAEIATPNGVGVIAGLVLGKPIGVTFASLALVLSGACSLPLGMRWAHVAGAGMLGGIGFTMSIFVTNLAFAASPATAAGSKAAVFLASVASGALGFLWLRRLTPK